MGKAVLTGIPKELNFGPVNYRSLEELESAGLLVEPLKHRTAIATIRVAIPAQLRAAETLFYPKNMGLPDTAYTGTTLSEDARYGDANGTSQLSKALAAYDRSDPGAARVVIVVGFDFAGTSPKLFWPKTLVYMLPGAKLNHMFTMVVATKLETTCEPSCC